jgi:hypothetical protein
MSSLSVFRSVAPHDEIIESAYAEIWLRRNCFALVPGLDYACFFILAFQNRFVAMVVFTVRV